MRKSIVKGSDWSINIDSGKPYIKNPLGIWIKGKELFRLTPIFTIVNLFCTMLV